MKTEYSNFSFDNEMRAIPQSCPPEIRAKIQAAREQRTAVRKEFSVEEDNATLKEFAASLEQ
jgi:hypothetical protein